MADLRIHNFGDTANGKVSGFIPNAHVGQIGWKNINPAADLLDRLMAEKALELNQAKHALDEQKLAYNAANDEANRGHAIELEMLKGKNAKDYLKQELSLRNSYVNKAKAEKKLEDDKVEEVRRFIRGVHTDRVQSGENISVLQTFKDIEDFARAKFGNSFVDEAFGRERGLENFKNTQSGNKGYNIGNRITDLQ